MKKFLLFLMLVISLSSFAKIQTKKIEYAQGDLKFEGFIAFDDSIKKTQPGIVIFHNWMGITNETENKAKEFAKLGMIAFAGDIYGKGIRPKDAKEAGELATKYKSDRKLLRERVTLALDELKKQKNINMNKIVAAGYCFGGTAALELGRTGADLKGIISFHGGLSNPKPEDAKNIKGKTLVFHGGVDPYVSKAEVDQFQAEMNESKVDYKFISYSNTVHSFTEKAAGNDNSKGAAYNEYADNDSFLTTKNFISTL
jgi:dienelactone hydrolase